MGDSPAKLITIAVVFMILPIPFVCLRFLARRKTRIQISWDDWLILLALLATEALSILAIVGATLGNMGGHATFGPDGFPVLTEKAKMMNLTTFANTVTQVPALGFTKLAVLLFYRRIFKGRIFDLASKSLLVLVTLWTVSFLVSHILVCVPVISTLGSHAIAEMGGTCVHESDMYLAQSYADIALDVLILITPIPIIMGLHMELARKVQICCLFLVGAITVASSVARTAVQYGVAAEFDSFNLDAPSFESPIIYWPVIEASIGIVAACLPLLRPLVESSSMQSTFSSLRGFLHISGSSTQGSSDASEKGFGNTAVESSHYDVIHKHTEVQVVETQLV